jgi:hypothetical protein
VYDALERQDYSLFGVSTALGAAFAFEASVAIFTLRTIINTKMERSKWTRPGIMFFLALSVLANVSYYFDLRTVDDVLMPGALTIAIPLALWLYAEEFSADARASIRKSRRPTATVAQKPADVAQINIDVMPEITTVPQLHADDTQAERKKATIGDWREIYRASNGDLRPIDAGVVREAVESLTQVLCVRR